jgi:DNA-binding CsgD family transcriptional regulator
MRPHLARAGLIASRLGLERACGALEAMTGLGMPAALLTRDGHIRETNALMVPGLIDTRAGGRIVLGSPAGDAALEAILSGHSTTRSIALPPAPTRQGRVAHVIPLSGGAKDVFGGRFWLLAMNVADGTRLRPDVKILRALFDLSPAESRLATALAGGNDLAESAKACGIQHSTARSYLEQIFRKTGVHRQAELVALIMGRAGGLV